MEDISRELERELKVDFKPVPHKKTRQQKIIIIDDFGEIRSGGWLKTVNRFLLTISIILLFSSGIFYYLYSDLKIKNMAYAEKMAAAEKIVGDLTTEKEILVAKLVILGEKPDQIIPESAVKDSLLTQKEPALPEEKTEEIIENQPEPELTAEEKVVSESPSIEAPPPGPAESSLSGKEADQINKTVAIEDFQVSRDRQNGDLLVRFDIRNISEQAGDVSGYIFTVLRSENQDVDDWLVVPTTTLKNGIPEIHKKGQYFSISRFKPVKFRIKKQSSPVILTKASIFVFNSDGDLIFNSVIDITDDGQA